MRATRSTPALPRHLVLATLLSLTLPANTRAQDSRASPILLEAIAWYTGTAGRVDDGRARALLLEATAEPADALARMWLARVHSRGRMGFARDESRARELAAQVLPRVRDLAAAGDREAAFLMGTAYDEGLGVGTDFLEAMRWYRRAADRGHVLAAHNVGNMHRDGRGVTVDHARAAVWWLRAANAGDVVPALRLGEAYEAGRGVPPRADRARRWYEVAASAGNADARRALERMRALRAPGLGGPRPRPTSSAGPST